MTTTTNRSLIAAANLARISAELAEAKQDVAMLERLKSAGDRAKRLTAELGKAAAEQELAIAADHKANEDARFAGISDISVSDGSPNESVLRTGFTIHYTRLAWDMNARASLPTAHTVSGFNSLPVEVLDYLIDRAPSRIPAKVIALAPSDPREAFRRYFRGLNLGYLPPVVGEA